MTESTNISEVGVGDVKRIASQGQVDEDFALFDNVEYASLRSYPIRLNMALLLVCTHGRCRLDINLRSHSLEGGEVLLALPRQVVEVNSVSDFKGFGIAVSPHFIDSTAPLRERVMSLFLRLMEHPVVRLNEKEMADIKDFYMFFSRWAKEKCNPSRREILKGITYSLLFLLRGIMENKVADAEVAATRKESILKSFILLLAQNYTKEKSVAWYAAQLGINPKHLTHVVKFTTGKTAGEWIDNYVLLEAKILLKSSGLSILQVSEKLGFSNQSFFGKYFKQHTGVSPLQYKHSSGNENVFSPSDLND